MDIKFVGNKYTNKSSRNGCKIIAIVNHITSCNKQTCIDWFTTPNNKESSAHYLVCKDGSVYQFLTDDFKSWHGGIIGNPSSKLVLVDMKGINPNAYTIGIEHEGQSGDKFTELQYQATLELHKQLIQKYGIIIDREHIIGHYQIDSIRKKNCPGVGFPWASLIGDLLAFFNQPKPITPQFAQWELEAVKWLVDSGFCNSIHLPNEEITFKIFAYLMNNTTLKQQSIQPIHWLMSNGYINSIHQDNEIITISMFGYIIANKLKETITCSPLQYLLNKGFLTQLRSNPNEVLTFGLFSALLKNAYSKGFKLN